MVNYEDCRREEERAELIPAVLGESHQRQGRQHSELDREHEPPHDVRQDWDANQGLSDGVRVNRLVESVKVRARALLIKFQLL